MSGISISIGGDISAFRAATKQLNSVVRQMSQQMKASLGTSAAAAAFVARAINGVGKSAKGAAQGVQAVGKGGGLLKLISQSKLVRIGLLAMTMELRAAGAGLGVLARTGGAAFSAMVRGARQTASTIKAVFSSLGSSLKGGGAGGGGSGGGGLFGMSLGSLAGLAGAASLLGLIGMEMKKSFDAAAGFEVMRTRVETFTGSVKEAKDMLTDLTRFGDKSPFLNETVFATAEKLLSYGVDKKKAPGMAKDLGAVARDDQSLLDLSQVMGHTFAKGKAQTRELRQFGNHGVPIFDDLKKVTGLTGDAFEAAVQKGIGFNDVARAIHNMSQAGGRFYGLLGRLGLTWNGLFKTLESGWNNLRRSFAEPILAAVKPVLVDAIGLVHSLNDKAAAAGKAIGDSILQVYALIKSGQTFELVRTGMAVAFNGGIDVLMRGLHSAVAFLATALPPIFQGAVATLRDPQFWSGIGMLFKGIAQEFAAQLQHLMADNNPLLSAESKATRHGIANTTGKIGALNQANGLDNITLSGRGVDMGSVIMRAMIDGAKAGAKAGVEMPRGAGLTNSLASMKRLMDGVKASAAKLRDSVKIPAPRVGGPRFGADDEGGERHLGGGFQLTTALGSIGGGGFGMTVGPMVSQQHHTNTLLTKIHHALTATKAHGGHARFG